MDHLDYVAHYDEWKQGQNPLSRLCHTCRTVKPLRAKHCRVCNRCVKEFDHHCPYIHNCVGYYNRVSFLLFVLMVNVNGVFEIIFLYKLAELENFAIRLDYLLALFLLAVYGFVAVNILGLTVYCAARNLTLNEIINRKRYCYLKNSKGEFFNPSDRGILQNLKYYLHLDYLEMMFNLTRMKNIISVDSTKVHVI